MEYPDVSELYLDYLGDIAKEDVAGLKKAQQSYGDSWKRRGGVGAFMMLARKWDRLENRVKQQALPLCIGSPSFPIPSEVVPAYDIFGHIAIDERSEGLIDDIRDLRRYLMLVEAEMRARGSKGAASQHRDNAGCPMPEVVRGPGFGPMLNAEDDAC